MLLSAYIFVICQVAITHSLSVNCHVSGRGPKHNTRLSHKEQVSVSCQNTKIRTIPVTCQLHFNSCPDHLFKLKTQLIANFLSLLKLNLRHPLVTWHIANKCRIPVTCHVTPLHPPVICYPCIPLSSVIPASYPPVICHTINARQIPVTCHVTPSLQLPFRYLSFSQHLSNSFHFCHVTSSTSSPVICRNPTQARQFLSLVMLLPLHPHGQHT